MKSNTPEENPLNNLTMPHNKETVSAESLLKELIEMIDVLGIKPVNINLDFLSYPVTIPDVYIEQARKVLSAASLHSVGEQKVEVEHYLDGYANSVDGNSGSDAPNATPPATGKEAGVWVNEWQPMSTAPKDRTIEFVNMEGEKYLAVWSDRPVCMLGSRNGGFPPGWATPIESDTDTNLPLDPGILWREYLSSSAPSVEKEGGFAEWASKKGWYCGNISNLWRNTNDETDQTFTTSSLMAEYKQYLINNK